MLYYSVNDKGCLVSISYDDLSGCSDWYSGDVGLTPKDDLFDEFGVYLYKVVNGRAARRSEEERRSDIPELPEPPKSYDERLDEVELISEMAYVTSEYLAALSELDEMEV